MNENTEDKPQTSTLKLAFILEAVLEGQSLLPVETALSLQPSSNDNGQENAHHSLSLKVAQIEADLIETLFLYLHIEQLKQQKFSGAAQIDDPLLMPLSIYLQNSLTQKNLFHNVWDQRINFIEQFDNFQDDLQNRTNKHLSEKNFTGTLDEGYFKSLFQHDGKSLRRFFHRVSFTLDECARLPTLIDLQLPLLRAFKHLQHVTLQILKSDDVMRMVCSNARENYFRLVGLIAMGWMALKIAKAIDYHKRLDAITTKFPTPLLSTMMVDSLRFISLILPECEMHYRILTLPLDQWQKISPPQLIGSV